MIRSAMFAACSERVVAFSRECSGRVRLTDEQLAGNRDDILVEARIGCCQKCGCLSAHAEFKVEDGVTYVVAKRMRGPHVLALGERVEPDPGKLP
jgi:hypothetical protein